LDIPIEETVFYFAEREKGGAKAANRIRPRHRNEGRKLPGAKDKELNRSSAGYRLRDGFQHYAA